MSCSVTVRTSSKSIPEGITFVLPKENLHKAENEPMVKRMEQFVLQLQADIVHQLEEIDGGEFIVDRWNRKEGGGGVSCVIQDSNVFEKAGVNVSAVTGPLNQDAANVMKSQKRNVEVGDIFYAVGISLVIHASNPMIPTCHANFRYFQITSNKDKNVIWWFGGGSDLTPNYLVKEDCKYFHSVFKKACDMHSPDYYPKFKEWCDRYFYNEARCEGRGIGGIFFDDLCEGGDINKTFDFVYDCGRAFLEAYAPIVRLHLKDSFTDKQKHWQQIRRGRYVEFNLVYDRGTKFGFVTPGSRIESILISLPLTSRWEYCYEPEPNSAEAELVNVLKNPVNWV